MPKDAYKYFRIEARELLDELGQGVLALERGASARDGVPPLLRLAHTLKGAARVVRQAGIADAAHRIEDALVPWREEPGVVAHDAVAAVLAGLADMEARLAALPAAEGAPREAPAPSAAASRPDAPARSLRTEVADMDALLAGLERTHGQVARLRHGREDVAAARALVRGLRMPGRDAGRARGDAAPAALADALQAAVARLDELVDTSAERLERELRQLRERTERLRLVPAGTLFARLERSARDVADAQGKQVAFEGVGGELRVDASTLDIAQGALAQMVRNAVAHGIEAPDARAAAGKPPVGRVIVEVRRQGRSVVLRCSDDGAGIDLDAVRRSAERRGRLNAAAPQDADALLRLLLLGGLSTSGTVTEVAGRGVGLDVAREAARRLGGTLSAHTVAGAGTTLELAAPLPLAALDVLMVEAGATVAAVPLDALERALRVGAGDIVRSGARETVLHDGQALPYVALERLLADGTPAPARARVSVLVLAHAGRRAAVGVDRLGEIASVLSRPLPELAPPCALAAGVATDIDGTPRLVLDAHALVRAAEDAQAPAVAPPAPPKPVLVVDDSLTTRMLETSILESAGYVVDAAASAEEGLERAKRRRYALFLVDVEMPGMDGFGFVERTRADPALRDVPAMLVSSRASLADRQRGAAAGAQGYIVKGEFAQDEFLARVRQLVGTGT
ncbi:MAG: hybrid sensor histidine kinase/response regulator [Burkholderiaceae bacterium]